MFPVQKMLSWKKKIGVRDASHNEFLGKDRWRRLRVGGPCANRPDYSMKGTVSHGLAGETGGKM
jgi:hypothetical protein